MTRGYIFYLLLLMLVLGSCEQEQTLQLQPIPVDSTASNKVVVINDEVNGLPIVIAGHSVLLEELGQEGNDSADNNFQFEFVVAFERTINNELVKLAPDFSGFPVIMKDENGNQFDYVGNVVSGPDAGNNLKPINSGIGYWFAFASAFPGIGINGYHEPDPDLAINPSSILPENTHICTAAGIDRIRALNDPIQLAANSDQLAHMSDDDIVLGVMINGVARAYPKDILNYHEVVNDVVGGLPIILSYCPLTGTGKLWERNSIEKNFGVSGQLYQSNLLMFDRTSESRWWQIGGEAIIGFRKGEKVTQRTLIETNWKKWKEMAPNTTVLSRETGYPYQYDILLYGDYQNEHTTILVPISRFSEDIIQAKEIVFAVIVENVAKVYQPQQFL